MYDSVLHDDQPYLYAKRHLHGPVHVPLRERPQIPNPLIATVGRANIREIDYLVQ